MFWKGAEMTEDPTVTDIKKILSLFKDKDFITSLDMDAISRLQVSLAVHNARLGELVAKDEKISKEAAANYEFKREQIYYNHRQAGKTGADSDNLKRIEAEPDRQFAIICEYNFKLVANLRKDVMNLIEAVRSRLSLLKDERRTSNETQNT
jgi:hypothetical protein